MAKSVKKATSKTKPAKRGRRSVLEQYPKKVEALLKGISQGLYFDTACKLAGIGYSTFVEIRRRGLNEKEEGKDTIYTRFVDKLEKAEAEAEAKAIKEIQNAGKKNWQAWAWFLERRYPHKYGKVVQAQNDNNLEIEFDYKIISKNEN